MTDTDNSPKVPDTNKRDELRTKIEASERRIARRTIADEAKEAADAAVHFVRKRPLTVLGGAIALGLVIGFSTKSGRRVARNAASGTASVVGSAAKGTANAARNASARKVSHIGTLLSDAVIAYGMKVIDEALDTTRAGRDKLEDIGDDASAKAREIRRDSEYLVGSTYDKGRNAARRTRRRAGRTVRDLKDRASN